MVEWKEYPEFPQYEVSNTGLVKHKKSDTPLTIRDRGDRGVEVRFTLWDTNQKKKYRVCRQLARIVATTWLPNPYNLPVVGRKDGNRHSTHVDNLVWCTRKDAQMMTNRMRWEITSPAGIKYTFDHLTEFCEQYGFVYKSVLRYANNNHKLKKPKPAYKGWTDFTKIEYA